MDVFTITIDGKRIPAREGQSVLNAALAAGHYIPHLCSHPDLPAAGNCRLCVVHIEGQSAIVPSCETLCQPEMRVTTQSEQLRGLRKVALELMLASHPHDCTSCKAYLQCELQALMQYLGVVHARMRTVKRQTAAIISRDPLIIREPERCVSCGRCVRACRDLRGIGALDFHQLDGETYVGTADHQPLAGTDCRFCGACVAVCPTGALQDQEGIFRKDLPKKEAFVPCQADCPAHTDIPRYVRLVKDRRYAEAVAVIREKLPFPHSLGHICNHACETACKRGQLNEALSIRELKRLAVEQDRLQPWRAKATAPLAPPSGKSVVVIGSGPAGLTAAYYLARKGHRVTVLERLKVAGGMLAAAIPEYRLPSNDVAAEIDLIREAGVEIQLGQEVLHVRTLKMEHDAVLVATGAWQGRKLLALPGGNAERTYAALEVLQALKLGQPISLGDTVDIIGGGNVAFDCARSLVRLGKQVNVVCLEKGEAMLADREEIDAARQEGIAIYDGMNSLRIETEEGRVSGHQVIEVAKFFFDDKQKLVVETIAGTERQIPCDSVIFAAGQGSHLASGFGLEQSADGYPICDPVTLQTSIDGVFAAGDAVTGTRFVINALAAGRQAAVSIDRYLGGDGCIDEVLAEPATPPTQLEKTQGFAALARIKPSGACLTCAEASAEGTRCLQCDLRRNIRPVKMWTDYQEGL